MKANAFALASLAGSFVVAGAASAAFSGLAIESFVGDGWMENGFGATGLTAYRLYAEFDGAGDDGVLSAFGISMLPASAQSWDGSFSNDAAFGGLTAPLDITPAIWTNQWDTYVTIGATSTVFNGSPDATSTSPGFSTETNNLGASWTSSNAGWFVTPDDEQSIAIDNRVLLAQFVVNSQVGPGAADVSGQVSLLLRDGNQVNQVGFSTPAPGALALLGLAGLAGKRRRRA